MFIDGSILSRQRRSSGRSCGSSKVLGSMGPRWPKPFYVLAVLAPIPFHPIPLVYLSFVAYLQILHIWQIPMAPSHGIYTHFIFYVSGFLRCQIFWGQENMSEAISFDAQKCCEQFIHMRICFKGLRMAKLLPWCQVDVPTELEKGELTWINMFGRPHGQTRETLPCFEMIKLEGREREREWVNVAPVHDLLMQLTCFPHTTHSLNSKLFVFFFFLNTYVHSISYLMIWHGGLCHLCFEMTNLPSLFENWNSRNIHERT